MPIGDIGRLGCCECYNCRIVQASQTGGALNSYTKAQAEARIAIMVAWVATQSFRGGDFGLRQGVWGSGDEPEYVYDTDLTECSIPVAQIRTVAFWDGNPTHFYRAIIVTRVQYCPAEPACVGRYEHGILAYPDEGYGTYVDAAPVPGGIVDLDPSELDPPFATLDASEWPTPGVDNGTFNSVTLRMWLESQIEAPEVCFPDP